MSTNRECFLDTYNKFYTARSRVLHSCMSIDYLEKGLADAEKSYELTANLIETKEVMVSILQSFHGTLEALQIALASLQILPQICCLEEDAYVFVTGKKLLLKVADESISPFLARWQWFETACIQDGHEKYIKAFFVDYHKFVKEFNAKLTNKSVDSFFTLSRHLEKLLVIG